MRTVWAVGAMVITCLALAALPAAAQSPAASAPSAFAQVTGTGGGSCTWAADAPVMTCTEQTSDPRVNGTSTRALDFGPMSPVKLQDALLWMDITMHGPDGDWTGTGYGVRDKDGTYHGVEMLAGHGAYDGLVYASWVTVPQSGTSSVSGFIQEGSLPPGVPIPPVVAPSASPSK
jgi:hypothetical protein